MKKVHISKKFEVLSISQLLKIKGGDLDEDIPLNPGVDPNDGGE